MQETDIASGGTCMRSAIVLTTLALLLAGCDSLPRGAGLQREVLAERQDRAAGEIPDFAVEPVTRERLALYAGWPAPAEEPMRWIERVDQPDTRIIAAGDTVAVTIWTTEENGLLTSTGQRFVTLPEIRVSSGGEVFLPYIGDMRISGMSPESARAAIEQRYLEVSPSAQVQLNMAEGRQNTVSLVSGVAAPGSYPLPDRDFTVMNLIAEGGGVAAPLRNPQIRLQRGGRIYGTSVDRLLENPRLDTTLAGGDKVYVEEDDRSFLSLGAAGSEAVHPFPEDEVTALEALSIIGGVAENRADAEGILILRRYPVAQVGPEGPSHPRTVFTIDLTSADGLFSAGQFLIHPGDLVYVTESPVTAAQTIFGLIGSGFGLARQASTVTN